MYYLVYLRNSAEKFAKTTFIYQKKVCIAFVDQRTSFFQIGYLRFFENFQVFASTAW
jgi:hypothetical protein